MTYRNDAARADVLGRWRMLAEQRLEHLTELFESGRWRRYHSEQTFLENIKEAQFAVETWRSLAVPQAAAERAVPALAVPLAAPAARMQGIEPPPSVASEPAALSAAAAAKLNSSGKVKPATDLTALRQALEMPRPAFELSAIEQRYPLLRNTL